MLLDHQHGDHDVTCKPAIANRPLPHSCKQRHHSRLDVHKIHSKLSTMTTVGTEEKAVVER